MNETVVVPQYQDATRRLTGLAAQAGPVDPAAIAPYLGYYNRGYRDVFDGDGVLRIRISTHASRVPAMADGSYIAASGFQVGTQVRFSRDSSGTPLMAT